MKRGEFLTRTTLGVGAACLGSKSLARGGVGTPVAAPPAKGTAPFSASDLVTLGKTGIRTSRLACGTGTVGVNHHSHQASLGVQGLADLLSNG